MKTTRLIKLFAAAALFVGGAAWNVVAADGMELWNKNCAACHGKDGKGQTTMGKKAGCKDYSDAKLNDAVTDDTFIKSVKEGVKEGGKEVMKSYAEKLNDEETKAILAYFRTLKK